MPSETPTTRTTDLVLNSFLGRQGRGVLPAAPCHYLK